MIRILVRYLDTKGNPVDEFITRRVWNDKEIAAEKGDLCRVGPPADSRIVSAELVPLIELDGNEIALDELQGRLSEFTESQVQEAQGLMAQVKGYPDPFNWS